MSDLNVIIGEESFAAKFEMGSSPKTVDAVRRLLPYSQRIMHVRWSGEACWIPLGDFKFDVPFEDATCHPAPGHFILYPGGVSETEILFAYGAVSFASKAGPLAGNHFMTIIDGLDRLAQVGRDTLVTGAKPIRIELA